VAPKLAGLLRDLDEKSASLIVSDPKLGKSGCDAGLRFRCLDKPASETEFGDRGGLVDTGHFPRYKNTFIEFDTRACAPGVVSDVAWIVTQFVQTQAEIFTR